MTGNPLGHLQRSSILQEIRDSGSPKRMGRECIRQPGVFEPAFKHSGCIDSGRRAVPELSRLAYRNRKKGCGWSVEGIFAGQGAEAQRGNQSGGFVLREEAAEVSEARAGQAGERAVSRSASRRIGRPPKRRRSVDRASLTSSCRVV